MAKEMVSKKPSEKLHVFDVVNYIVFILIGLVIIVPIWKVVVDSFNKVGVYQFMLWPNSLQDDNWNPAAVYAVHHLGCHYFAGNAVRTYIVHTRRIRARPV